MQINYPPLIGAMFRAAAFDKKLVSASQLICIKTRGITLRIKLS
jgi:hypothetical protein